MWINAIITGCVHYIMLSIELIKHINMNKLSLSRCLTHEANMAIFLYLNDVSSPHLADAIASPKRRRRRIKVKVE